MYENREDPAADMTVVSAAAAAPSVAEELPTRPISPPALLALVVAARRTASDVIKIPSIAALRYIILIGPMILLDTDRLPRPVRVQNCVTNRCVGDQQVERRQAVNG